MPPGDLGEGCNVCLTVDHAGGIPRRTHHNQPRSIGHRGFERFGVKLKVIVQIDRHRRSTRKVDQMLVGDEVRVGYQDLVPTINACQQGQKEPARNARGNAHVGRPVELRLEGLGYAVA